LLITSDGLPIATSEQALSITAEQFRSGIEIAVTASDPEATASSHFRLTVSAVPVAGAPAAAPRLVRAPVLLGSTHVGEATAVDPGIWEGEPAPTLALSWLRDGDEIVGANGDTYTPAPGEDGTVLTCRVTASNAAGSTSAQTAGRAVRFAAPVIVDPGTISGSAETGSEHTVVGFAASGDNLTYTYEWSLDDSPIDGATAASYTPDAEGKLVRKTMVQNSGGAKSCATPALQITAPGIAPSIAQLVSQVYSAGSGRRTYDIAALTTGTAPIEYGLLPKVLKVGIREVGLHAYELSGLTAGTPTPALTYQWKVDSIDVSGATSAIFDNAVESQEGALTCEIAARNSHGSALYTTAALAIRAPLNLSAYNGPSGQAPTLILDFDGEVYAADNGSGLATVTPYALINNFTSISDISGVGHLILSATSSCNIATSAFSFSNTAGTLHVKFRASAAEDYAWVAGTDDGGADYEDCIQMYRSPNKYGYFYVDNGSTVQAELGIEVVPLDSSLVQMAAAWESNNFGFSMNGAAVANAAGTVPSSQTTLHLGNLVAG
jgi:hypothetical protein